MLEEDGLSSDIIFVTQEQFDQSNMKLGSMVERSFPEVISANGVIDVPPQNKAIIHAKMGGYVKSTSLLVGDHVKKGQLLFTIENPEFVTIQQSYLEAKEQLVYLKSEYERQKTLFQENITSQKNYLKAESNYKTTQASYNGLKKQLQLLNILPSEVEKGKFTATINSYAPMSGNITKINVSKGSYITPTTTMMEIIDNEHIHLELSVFEKDILKIKKKQKIYFKTPEASDEMFTAEVYLVGSSIDENRMIKVHGHPMDTSQSFLTGMFVNANIVYNTVLSKALPEASIVATESGNFILSLISKKNDGYEFKKIKVATNYTHDGFSSIESEEEFTENTLFLTSGAYPLIGE